jgi:SAM-dependent methyltransferase
MNILIQNSSIVKYIFNRFDYIIRFFYCKMMLYKIFDLFLPHLYSSNYESLNSYFLIISDALKKNNFSISGKTVLEIGPGNSYINAYNFLLNGARKVILVDKYPRQSNDQWQKSYIKKEIEYCKSIYDVGRLEYIDESTCELNTDYIAFMAGDLSAIQLDAKVDFVYSIAVLHHVKDLDRYVKKMHAILNPGGMMYHVVDLKDKFHFFGNPFVFYKYSDFTWEYFLTDKAVTYTNRVRHQEYIDIFDRNGFDLVYQKTITYETPDFPINKKFSTRPDLDIGDAHFLLRKR